MTIREKLQSLDWDNPIEKLVALAYLAGQEVATRKICDEHNKRVAKMRTKASEMRYHKLANAVIDAAGGDIIYDSNYAQGVLEELCEDEWPL